MATNDRILTQEQVLLVQYRVAGMTIGEAAKLLGIGESTAHRWLRLPHVQAALDEAKAQLTLDVKTKVHQRMEEMAENALKAIDEFVVGHEDVPAAVRLKASQLVLDRVAPVEQQVSTGEQEQVKDDELLQFMTDEELAQLEEILARAEARKQEAERNIIPLRRMA